MRLLPISSKATLLVSFLLLFNQCSRNPVTGKKELSFMSESQEKALGASSDPQIQAEFGVYPDEKLQTYINEKGQAMAKISHRPTLPFQFKVMDSPVVNAFAVPGGYVYFTRGILAHFNNEAQLNGVLGHEIGHVTARHGARSQTSQILSQVVLIGAMIASPKLAQYGEQLSQGMQLLFLKYSRDHESESDVLGVQYSQKVGIATFERW
jgi:predicted Zn-dependent protease